LQLANTGLAIRLRLASFSGDRAISYRTPLALLLLSLSMIAAVWWWLGLPVTLAHAPIDSTTKLECVSYSPFQGRQSPWTEGLIIPPEQIAADFVELARISKCVRTYSVDNGLDKAPELAAKAGLKVILGVWIGKDRAKNALLIDTAVSLVKDYPDVITALVVGSEVLLRKDLTASELREVIHSVKTRVNIPVTYAEVLEFWQRYPEVASDVDFVTVHFLPYWEDDPPRAEDAAAYVDDMRKRMTAAFPGKEVLIGETGWPSEGRMRDEAIPSRINQARFISEILDRAKRENFRVSLFEAYDEPWKRRWEGTVGGHWGLSDRSDGELKYPQGAAISNHPFWMLQLGSGLAFGTSIFGAAFLALRRRPSSPQLVPWLAVAISATVGGSLLGLATEKLLHESYGFGGWLIQGLLFIAAVAAPLLASRAVMSGHALPTFRELIRPREGKPPPFPVMILGFALIVSALTAMETALGLVFDPRWRDFPFAALTMATVPFWTLTLIDRPKSGSRPMAETVLSGLFAATALYILFNEGFHNWQSLWTCASYFLIGHTLWQARAVTAAEGASTVPAVLREVDLFGKESGGAQPDLSRLTPAADFADRNSRVSSR